MKIKQVFGILMAIVLLSSFMFVLSSCDDGDIPYWATNIKPVNNSGNSNNNNSNNSSDYDDDDDYGTSSNKRKCGTCYGTGWCRPCDGSGEVWVGGVGSIVCGACKGTGICQICHGTGLR